MGSSTNVLDGLGDLGWIEKSAQPEKKEIILNPAVEIHHEAHEGHEVKNLRSFLAGIRTHLLGDAVAECGFCTMPWISASYLHVLHALHGLTAVFRIIAIWPAFIPSKPEGGACTDWNPFVSSTGSVAINIKCKSTVWTIAWSSDNPADHYWGKSEGD